ncbi:collagen alpha-1(I) chain-like [Perognathus longimembris pacificus]|uniref:collagen alpha-1(I) chain-like n=1 Tax=Perognathus longimembris pacificus TaxID=214514 RepID=UPI002019CF67|nr:collagen alpha-1(I) chain-like [Perognathus longimembris pacificus]
MSCPLPLHTGNCVLNDASLQLASPPVHEETVAAGARSTVSQEVARAGPGHAATPPHPASQPGKGRRGEGPPSPPSAPPPEVRAGVPLPRGAPQGLGGATARHRLLPFRGGRGGQALTKSSQLRGGGRGHQPGSAGPDLGADTRPCPGSGHQPGSAGPDLEVDTSPALQAPTWKRTPARLCRPRPGSGHQPGSAGPVLGADTRPCPGSGHQPGSAGPDLGVDTSPALQAPSWEWTPARLCRPRPGSGHQALSWERTPARLCRPRPGSGHQPGSAGPVLGADTSPALQAPSWERTPARLCRPRPGSGHQPGSAGPVLGADTRPCPGSGHQPGSAGPDLGVDTSPALQAPSWEWTPARLCRPRPGSGHQALSWERTPGPVQGVDTSPALQAPSWEWTPA